MTLNELEPVFSQRGWLSHQPKPFRTQFIGLVRLVSLERAGDWFGHGPVLRGGPRTLTFIASEPTTLLQVPLERLRRRCGSTRATTGSNCWTWPR